MYSFQPQESPSLTAVLMPVSLPPKVIASACMNIVPSPGLLELLKQRQLGEKFTILQ